MFSTYIFCSAVFGQIIDMQSIEVIRHKIFTRIYAHLNVCTTVQILLVPKICIKIDSFVNLLLETII
jgi:hypothetical protein